MLINKFEGICYDIEEEKENEFAFLDRDFENVLKEQFSKKKNSENDEITEEIDSEKKNNFKVY